MIEYYRCIETIISMELSICQFSFSSKQIIELNHSIQNSLPFFNSGILDQDENTVMSDISSIIISGKATPDFNMTTKGKKLKEF